MGVVVDGDAALDVALLAEGVDRNEGGPTWMNEQGGSPSSRRAWIEMVIGDILQVIAQGRPPRGGRG